MVYRILYETGTIGCTLGNFDTYKEADLLFNKVIADLLKPSATSTKDYSYFEMYSVFHIPTICPEYERYTIGTHKNQITKPTMIWSTPAFCLYIIKTEDEFNVNALLRTQNHFYFEKSKYLEGTINLILN